MVLAPPEAASEDPMRIQDDNNKRRIVVMVDGAIINIIRILQSDTTKANKELRLLVYVDRKDLYVRRTSMGPIVNTFLFLMNPGQTGC